MAEPMLNWLKKKVFGVTTSNAGKTGYAVNKGQEQQVANEIDKIQVPKKKSQLGNMR